MKLMEIYRQMTEADYDNEKGKPFWGNYGAGVLTIAKSTGRFLVAFRSELVNEPNTYGILGGKVDDEDGLNLESEAIREFKEESGYSGTIKLIKAYRYITDGFEYQNFIGVIPDEFKAVTDWETDHFEWMSLDELLNAEPKHFGLSELLNDSKSISIIKKLSEKFGDSSS